jgi:hypothetical protein
MPPAVRARNGISYLTERRFSAQNRLGAIRALKRLKARGSVLISRPQRSGFRSPTGRL